MGGAQLLVGAVTTVVAARSGAHTCTVRKPPPGELATGPERASGLIATLRPPMPMPRPPAYLVVFVASCCTLILELVAGRILAPFIGVSLYTWTSIIGVVLAGISLGNYLGGRIADRWP